MKKELVPFTPVRDFKYTKIKDKKPLKLNTKRKYPKTLKELSLNVLGYFYAQNY